MKKVRYTPTFNSLIYFNLTPNKIYDVVEFISSTDSIGGYDCMKIINDVGNEEFCYVYGLRGVEFVDATKELRNEIIDNILK